MTENESPRCQCSTQFTVSRFRRWMFLQELEKQKANHPDIKIKLRETSYLFSSDFYMTIDGTAPELIDAFNIPFGHWALRQGGVGPMKNRGGSGFRASLH